VPPPPPELDRLAEELARVYRAAWDEILAEQEAILADPARWRRRARLAEMERSVAALTREADAQAARWVAERFGFAYGLGAEHAAAVVDAPFTWARPHLEAVTRMAADTFGDLLAATTNVRATTKRFLREVSRSRALAGAVIGRTPRQMAAEVARIAAEAGIHAVTYANGARVGLGPYAEMVIRTKTGVAYNAGTIGHATAAGTRYFECFDGSACGLVTHEDAEKPNGRVYDADTAASHSLSHPNCIRAWSPRPDVTSATGARRAPPSTTEAQRADAAASEAELAAGREARAKRTARQARTPRRAAPASA
jgi:hypothetical protein